MALQATTDPLTLLPPELVLRILDFATVPALAAATCLSRAWHTFIDDTHQDVIYSSATKTKHPSNVHDFDFLKNAQSFVQYYDNTKCWKDLCKQQTVLSRNWDQQRPITTDLIRGTLWAGSTTRRTRWENSVWRFRPDFKRRIMISTAHSGGIHVLDLDTWKTLWSLPSTLMPDTYHAGTDGKVRPHAHLEYQDGTAVWDREGNALEVWKTGLDGLARGEFRLVAVLPHDCQTRGFQLSHGTLCVVSTEGQAFVYDMEGSSPTLKTRLQIEEGASGHLDQDEDVVMYSMGKHGYRIHDKLSGACLGVLQPWRCNNLYHIKHPEISHRSEINDQRAEYGHPCGPSIDRLEPIQLERGPLPTLLRPEDEQELLLSEDEWGAGMLSFGLMVGVSRHGRIFICQDWREAMKQPELQSPNSIVESQASSSSFDLGGWLSVKNNRILFEVQDRAYVLALTDEGALQDLPEPQRASYSFSNCEAAGYRPVSFMALYDDCIMSTYSVRSSLPMYEQH
ncbi:hypothetical protein LTR08_004574 [Meristemomyces frigidus]|nr:hypothetical protein LTR08_004574 [Meristemomyces frigidus]